MRNFIRLRKGLSYSAANRMGPLLSMLCMLAAAGLIPAVTFAQSFTPTAQTRYVYTTAFASDPSGKVEDADYDEAPDFRPFNAFVGAGASRGGAFDLTMVVRTP